MAVTDPAGARPTGEAGDDRSTRARIRDAALAQFAEHGLRGASIRAIAADAGVSPGAVQTHFPTKDALRQACDAHVMAVLQARQAQITEDLEHRDREHSALADPSLFAAVSEELQPILAYLATSLASGSTSAGEWFDAFCEQLHGLLTDEHLGPPLPDTEETADLAAVLAAMQIGLTMLLPNVRRARGIPESSPELLVRLGRARLTIAAQRLISEEHEARTRAALDSYAQAHDVAAPAATTAPEEGHDG